MSELCAKSPVAVIATIIRRSLRNIGGVFNDDGFVDDNGVALDDGLLDDDGFGGDRSWEVGVGRLEWGVWELGVWELDEYFEVPNLGFSDGVAGLSVRRDVACNVSITDTGVSVASATVSSVMIVISVCGSAGFGAEKCSRAIITRQPTAKKIAPSRISLVWERRNTPAPDFEAAAAAAISSSDSDFRGSRATSDMPVSKRRSRSVLLLFILLLFYKGTAESVACIVAQMEHLSVCPAIADVADDPPWIHKEADFPIGNLRYLLDLCY